MDEGYLRGRVVGMAPAEDAEWMEGVVAEALRAKAARGDGLRFLSELLGPKALDDRVGLGVRWGEYAVGGGRRLTGHTDDVTALAECEGRVCSGSDDGSIWVWRMGEATEERLLYAGAKDAVLSLSAWESHLISGHASGELRVWNVVTGVCNQVIKGHTDSVCALAVCGSRLASSSFNESIKLWAMRAAGPWTCERTLLGHTDWVWSLTVWKDKVLSGSCDKSIRVWDVETGEHDATLTGHTGGVCGLAVHGDRLFSASDDGTIRVWALGTWAALRMVDAYGRRTGQYPRCLAVSGSQLVSGSIASGDYGGQKEVRVWGLETLNLQHTLPQPAGANVWALLVVEGRVWAGVGSDVVVWGRGARGGKLSV
jgi:WD40 repeat protein